MSLVVSLCGDGGLQPPLILQDVMYIIAAGVEPRLCRSMRMSMPNWFIAVWPNKLRHGSNETFSIISPTSVRFFKEALTLNVPRTGKESLVVET